MSNETTFSPNAFFALIVIRAPWEVVVLIAINSRTALTLLLPFFFPA